MSQTQDSIKKLYQKVEKVKLETIIPNYKFPKGNDHAIIDPDGNILNFCSSSYNLRPNSTLHKPLEELMKKNKIEFQQKINIVNGVKFYVDYILKEKVKSVVINDIVPKFTILNSYDGTLKTTIQFGFHRVICGNGLTRPCGTDSIIARKHRKPIKTEDQDLSAVSPDDILEGIKEFIKSTKEDMAIYEKLHTKKSDAGMIIKLAEKLKLSKNIIETANNRFELETNQKGTLTFVNDKNQITKHKGYDSTLYVVYNAINYAIYNTNLKEFPEVKVKRDKAVLAEILSHA